MGTAFALMMSLPISLPPRNCEQGWFSVPGTAVFNERLSQLPLAL